MACYDSSVRVELAGETEKVSVQSEKCQSGRSCGVDFIPEQVTCQSE